MAGGFQAFCKVDRSDPAGKRVKYRLPKNLTIIDALTDLLRHPLICHPSGACPAIYQVEAAAGLLATGALALTYSVSCDMSEIVLPDPLPAGQADGLWQHTCCEAFVAAVGGSGYREFNFSPSGQWAAYAFADYRMRDHAFQPACAPELSLSILAGSFRLNALVRPELLPIAEEIELSLTLVLEATNGSKTYWALKHAADQPDFHLRQSFALNLRANTP